MDKNRLVEPELIDGDTKEISLRPKWLDEYIGQDKVVENLKIFNNINHPKVRNRKG